MAGKGFTLYYRKNSWQKKIKSKIFNFLFRIPLHLQKEVQTQQRACPYTLHPASLLLTSYVTMEDLQKLRALITILPTQEQNRTFSEFSSFSGTVISLFQDLIKDLLFHCCCYACLVTSSLNSSSSFLVFHDFETFEEYGQLFCRPFLNLALSDVSAQ